LVLEVFHRLPDLLLVLQEDLVEPADYLDLLVVPVLVVVLLELGVLVGSPRLIHMAGLNLVM
jgi:hypothetical protein